MEPTLEICTQPVTLAALGCAPSVVVNDTKFKVRLRDTVRFLCARFSDHPNVSVGLPMVAGIPYEQMEALVVDRLKKEYEQRQMPWPLEETEAGGKN